MRNPEPFKATSLGRNYWVVVDRRTKRAADTFTRDNPEQQARDLAAELNAGEEPGPFDFDGPACGARTVFWPDQEACDAECALPQGHTGDHEDSVLGPWDNDD